MEPTDSALKRLAEKTLLLERLLNEDEHDLAEKIRECGAEFPFTCQNCGCEKMGHKRCKRKWCPRCAPAIAAARSERIGAAVDRFRWPLFITLTMKNVEDLNFGAIRQLRRSFGKMRHTKWWKKNTKGGVAAIEVTNIGNGWHPHLHSVIDCRWLSVTEPEVRPFWSRQEKAAAYQRATSEVEKKWSKYLGQPLSSIKIKRADRATITKEVIKYSVKGSDLISCEGKIGNLIRAIEGCRLLTTFGTVHGRVCEQPDPTSEKADDNSMALEKHDGASDRCCDHPTLIPTDVFVKILNGTRGWRTL